MPELRSFASSQGRLTYILSGAGPARIVLVNGAGMTLRGWRGLYPRIEGLGRVLAWNRLGVRGTDVPRGPQSAAEVLAGLRELLVHARLEPPYVLVGHSLGAVHAELFARANPQQVAGLLLLAPSDPDRRGTLRRQGPQILRALGKVLGLPQPVFRASWLAEMQGLGATAAQLQAAPPFPPVPTTVITGGRRAGVSRLPPRGRQVVAAASGHFPHLTEPRLVLGELQDLLRRAQAAARSSAMNTSQSRSAGGSAW